ncbi:MAG: hypothetical protein OEZ16_00700 [Chromatiales bacterium]|nr:hypothetical protein [Chromatiales bacterium]
MARLFPIALLLTALMVITGCPRSDTPIVKVFKDNQTLQCQPDSGIPLEVMAQELTGAGIDVICAQQGNIGGAVITLCGATTGGINIFAIHQANLPDAMALGFADVALLPDYRDQSCQM